VAFDKYCGEQLTRGKLYQSDSAREKLPIYHACGCRMGSPSNNIIL